FTLRYENKEYVLDEQIPTINDNSTQDETKAHQKHYDDANKVSCIMAASMSPELQKTFEFTWAYEMNLKETFQAKASKERLDETSIMALHSLLQTAEQVIKKIDVPSTSAAPVLTVGHNAKKRYTSHSNWKGKATRGKFNRGSKRKAEYDIAPTNDPKEAGLKENRRLKHEELNLVMGNRKITLVTRIEKYELMLKSGDGYQFSFDNKNEDILVYSNNCFMFKASPCKGIYETVKCISNNGNVILNVGSSNELDKSKLWHSRLGHVNKKHIAQLQKAGVLESFDFKSDDVCESCLLGKMTKSPFTDGKRYYITFTNDFSRYGYVYLIKHKSDTFEVFKRYQNEVENQLGRKIKLTPHRTPQLNGVAERRNRTLLDMVSKTPFEMWKGKRPSLGHIKYEGSRCVFLTFPIVLRPFKTLCFFNYALILRQDYDITSSLRRGALQSVYKEPIVNTDTQQEVVTPVEPEDISLPIRRTSSIVSKAHQYPRFYYGFHIKEDTISDSTLSELDEPANYKEAMASPEAAKWKEAMKSEIQSMHDNQMDVKTHFLNEKLTNDVFMAQSEGFENTKFIVYGGERKLRVTGYCDASFQTDKDESFTAWVAYEASKEVIWMKNFIGDIGIVPTLQHPIEIFCEYESAVALTKESKDHRKSKHIERKYHFVRSKVEEGHVIMKDIRSKDNIADPFIKALAKSRHDEHARSIGLKDKIKF
nr:hypothetical protein [Tanacetum cinerariifolium]